MATHNIIVAGVGGQGSIMTSHIIAEAAIKSGIDNVRVGETYGASMRGGCVTSHVRINGAFAPLMEEDTADLIIALEPLEGLRNGVVYLAPNGRVIMNKTPLLPMDCSMGYAKYPEIDQIISSLERLGDEVITIPATRLAVELGEIRVLSTIMIGAAAGLGLLDVDPDVLYNTLLSRVPQKTVKINDLAFDRGYSFVKTRGGF